MSKEFLDRVKANQAVNAATNPLPVVTIKVSVMNDNSVQVTRPEGDSPQQLATILTILAAAQQIICQVLAKAEPSRIVTPPAGLKVT